MNALIGRKLGMTRIFAEDGVHVPVTVIEAGPCAVVQVRETDVQLGFGARKATRTPKAMLGHVKRAGLESAHRVLKMFLPSSGEPPKPGESITVAIFAPGTGAGVPVSRRAAVPGRGTSAPLPRRPRDCMVIRVTGSRRSIAPGTDPSRVIKGKRMPGHMGARRTTQLGLTVIRVDAERNLLFVRGAVPGSMNGLLTVRKQGGRSRHD